MASDNKLTILILHIQINVVTDYKKCASSVQNIIFVF